MARRLLVDGVDRIGLTQRGSIRLASTARNGEVGMGGWNTDDDAAALAFPGLKVARLIEDASGADKHIWRGRIWIKNLARGDWFMGNARRFAVNVVDSNWDFSKLRVHASPRPAESDVARVLWLVGYILNGGASTATNARARASTVFGTSTYVPNTNLVTLPARSFDNSDPFGVLDDAIRSSGKTFFPVLNDDGTLDLFYDLPTSTAYASTLSITDDGTADGITSYAPAPDGPSGTQDPSELLSGVGLVTSTGAVTTAYNPTIEAAYDVAEVTTFDQGASAPTAAARAAQILVQRGVEEDRYRCFIDVAPARAHLLKAGMTLSFRSAAAGVTAPITVRVVRCEPELTMQNLYRLHLELAFPEKVTPRLQSSGYVPILGQGLPVVGSGGAIYALQLVLSVDGPTVVVYIAAGFAGGGATQFLIDNAAFAPTDRLHWYLRDDLGGNHLGGEFAAGVDHTVVIGINATQGYASVDGSAYATAPIGAWAGARTAIAIGNSHPTQNLRVRNLASAGALIDDFSRVVASGWGTASDGNLWTTFVGAPVASVDGTSGLVLGAAANLLRLELIDTELGGAVAYYGNSYGPVQVAVADGIVSSWTLPTPAAYIPGTLEVKVDGIPQIATETAPASGTFSLPWVPGAGDIISATWRVPVGP